YSAPCSFSSFHRSRAHLVLYSVPTRRSSDLDPVEGAPGHHSVQGADQRLPHPVLLGAEEEPRVVLAPRVGMAEPALLAVDSGRRSEEHTSELQSRVDLVCRLLLEKKK